MICPYDKEPDGGVATAEGENSGSETWLLDPARAKWTLVEPENTPQGRSSNQLAAADAADGSKRIYMFGGYTSSVGAFRFHCG